MPDVQIFGSSRFHDKTCDFFTQGVFGLEYRYDAWRAAGSVEQGYVFVLLYRSV